MKKPVDPNATTEARLLAAMDLAAFECRADRTLCLIGSAPGWLRRFVTPAPARPVDLFGGGHFLFLAEFMEVADAFWEQAEPGDRCRSGLWTESDASGCETHLEATAVYTGAERVLLIEQMGADYYERRDLLQKARAGKLEAQRRLSRETSGRELAEEQVHALRAQLAHVGRISSMGELAASLAHELNQPLWAMINYVQAAQNMLNAQGAPEPVRSALQKAVAQAERASGILRGLRAFIADGSPGRVATEINRLVREVAQLLEGEVREADVTLTLELADGLPSVPVEPIQIQQVLFNLMRNGIDALTGLEAGRERRLTVRTAAGDRGRVVVTVSDTGPGCDDEALGRLFDAFFSTKSAGMGMGLAISRSIIEAHEGTIEGAREPGGGMTFRIELPIDGTGGAG